MAPSTTKQRRPPLTRDARSRRRFPRHLSWSSRVRTAEFKPSTPTRPIPRSTSGNSDRPPCEVLSQEPHFYAGRHSALQVCMSSSTSIGKSEDGPRQRGAREYFSHRGVYRNPFDAGTFEFNEYERGWMQSLKLNEGKLVNVSWLPPAPSKNSAPSPASNYNAYAELKGRSHPRK